MKNVLKDRQGELLSMKGLDEERGIRKCEETSFEYRG
jgi:hypothetical protein